MGFWKMTRKVIGHVIDLRVDRWSDVTSLKKTTSFFWDYFKALFTLEKATHSENFEEAVERLNLTPDHLAKQSKQYLLFTLFFAFLTGALLLYTIILACLGNGMGTCISFSLALYAASLLFRFYVWYFQMTHKKLGCGFREWYQSLSLIKRIPKNETH